MVWTQPSLLRSDDFVEIVRVFDGRLATGPDTPAPFTRVVDPPECGVGGCRACSIAWSIQIAGHHDWLRRRPPRVLASFATARQRRHRADQASFEPFPAKMALVIRRAHALAGPVILTLALSEDPSLFRRHVFGQPPQAAPQTRRSERPRVARNSSRQVFGVPSRQADVKISLTRRRARQVVGIDQEAIEFFNAPDRSCPIRSGDLGCSSPIARRMKRSFFRPEH